jgi:import inner membrane translocase subunit TIM21
MRTTARTTSLGVILLGAGFSVLLVYSLTSELFSKNSPTVLYSNACERIKQSAHVCLTFIHCLLNLSSNFSLRTT